MELFDGGEIETPQEKLQTLTAKERTGKARIRGPKDLQTEKGKVISGICKLARKYKKPIIAVCGVKEEGVSNKLGLSKVYTILEIADSFNDAIENVEK